MMAFVPSGRLYFRKPSASPIFSTPPSARVFSLSVSISLYFTELLPELRTRIFIYFVFDYFDLAPIAWQHVSMMVL